MDLFVELGEVGNLVFLWSGLSGIVVGLLVVLEYLNLIECL